jgi:5'-nucleotidase
MALGVPSIALSQALISFHEDVNVVFETSVAFAPGIILQALRAGWAKDVILNLNFPDAPVADVKEVEVTRQGFRNHFNIHFEKRTDLRGRDYYWTGYGRARSEPDEGTDLKAIYEGRISVTPLHIDLTHMPSVRDLKLVLGGVPPKA